MEGRIVDEVDEKVDVRIEVEFGGGDRSLGRGAFLSTTRFESTHLIPQSQTYHRSHHRPLKRKGRSRTETNTMGKGAVHTSTTRSQGDSTSNRIYSHVATRTKSAKFLDKQISASSTSPNLISKAHAYLRVNSHLTQSTGASIANSRAILPPKLAQHVPPVKKSQFSRPQPDSDRMDFRTTINSGTAPVFGPPYPSILPPCQPRQTMCSLSLRRADISPQSAPYSQSPMTELPQSRSHMPRRSVSSHPKPSPLRLAHMRPRPAGEAIKDLPISILLRILELLRENQLRPGSFSCSTCHMRDLVALSLASKQWWCVVKIALYSDIQIVGHESKPQTKVFKKERSSRMVLLRRTLMERPEIAQNVRTLSVPAMADTINTRIRDQLLDMVVSLVQACPNLESLIGLYPSYNHQVSRLDHALSTKEKLKERLWIIEPSLFKRQTRYTLSDDKIIMLPVSLPAPLLPQECATFQLLHSRWPNLETLVLHCNQGGTLDSTLFADVTIQLPSLQNLHVSGFPPDSFTDTTLVSLPPLKSLRLENLSGITARGLTNYSTRGNHSSLTSLSLVSIPILSLPVIARLFNSLKSLTRFTISQGIGPKLPRGIQVLMHPYLASTSLQYLHWELTDSMDHTATIYLAKSISANGFPALRTLRAPTDHDGLLQQLCKPRERIALPSDTYRTVEPCFRVLHLNPSTAPPSMASSSTKSKSPTTWSILSQIFTRSSTSLHTSLSRPSHHPESKSSLSTTTPQEPEPERGTHLVTARRLAQRRIDSASAAHDNHIRVYDEQGRLIDHRVWGAYVGDLRSRIRYWLGPDAEWMDYSLVRVEDLVDRRRGRGREEVGGWDGCGYVYGCMGAWNFEDGGWKERERERRGHVHVERYRWREIRLKLLF